MDQDVEDTLPDQPNLEQELPPGQPNPATQEVEPDEGWNHAATNGSHQPGPADCQEPQGQQASTTQDTGRGEGNHAATNRSQEPGPAQGPEASATQHTGGGENQAATNRSQEPGPADHQQPQGPQASTTQDTGGEGNQAATNRSQEPGPADHQEPPQDRAGQSGLDNAENTAGLDNAPEPAMKTRRANAVLQALNRPNSFQLED